MRASAIVVVIAMGAGVAAAEPTREYKVKAGDTCIGIATRELGDRDRIEEIHRLNPWLGPSPHNLKAGTILKLPPDVVDPDAHLTAQRGHVEVRRAGEPAWQRADTGADLFRAWRVGSREESTAQVTFADDSAIAMRENTVVVIYGRTRTASATEPMHATLEKGALRTRLAELDGKPSPTVAVAALGGTATLSGGSAVLDVDAAGQLKVSNHRGKAVALAGKLPRAKATPVGPGFGSSVAPGKLPTPPQPLPPTPSWRVVPALALGWTGHGATVHAAWEPMPGVQRFRVELARDRDLSAVDARFELSPDAVAVDAQQVPPGDYWISVASIDKKGFESVPAPVRPVHVVELALPAVAASAAPGAAPRVALGTLFTAPAGLSCAVGGGSPAHDFVATGEGVQQIACVNAEGMGTAIDIDVAPVRIARWSGSIPPTAQRGTLDVQLDGAPVGELVAHAPDGLAIERVEAQPGGARITVRLAGATAGAHPIAIGLVPRAGAAELPLGEADLVVEAAPGRAPRSPEHDPHIGIAAFGGVRAVRYQETTMLGGAAVELRSRGAIGLDASAWFGDGPALFEAGVSLHVPRTLLPGLRLGMTWWSDARDPGAYLGADLAIPLARGWSARAAIDAVLDRDRATALQTSLGLRYWLW